MNKDKVELRYMDAMILIAGQSPGQILAARIRNEGVVQDRGHWRLKLRTPAALKTATHTAISSRARTLSWTACHLTRVSVPLVATRQVHESSGRLPPDVHLRATPRVQVPWTRSQQDHRPA